MYFSVQAFFTSSADACLAQQEFAQPVSRAVLILPGRPRAFRTKSRKASWAHREPTRGCQ